MVTETFTCTAMVRCLERGDWIHHNLVAAACDSVGKKDEDGIVSSQPPAAIEGAGEFGIVNETQGVGGSPPSPLPVHRECSLWHIPSAS